MSTTPKPNPFHHDRRARRARRHAITSAAAAGWATDPDTAEALADEAIEGCHVENTAVIAARRARTAA